MAEQFILTVNAGSSSIKFVVFSGGAAPVRVVEGKVERIGDPDTQLVVKELKTGEESRVALQAKTHEEAAGGIVDYIARRFADAIVGIGHRVVHGGMRLVDHQRVTPEVMAELRRVTPLDMAHLPREIALIEAFGKALPQRPQVVCFDTAFCRDLPGVSRMLPIPREFTDAGVRRFGFHGLSYTYLMGELEKLAGPEAAKGRIILAHLGAGASMTAVRGGAAVDTTMAFTPIAGLVMATRPGDLDAGFLVYLMREKKMSADEVDEFISKRCGLLGVSQTSSDMRDLLARRGSDRRAAEAIELFCYSAKKYLCALAGAMGGLDTVVFAGGIGEHVPEVRAGICRGLEFLGVEIDTDKNAAGSGVISAEGSRVAVRVIPTDEEVVIARVVASML